MRIDKKKPNNLREHKINKEIRARFVFLIDSQGEKVGSVPFFDALDRAVSEGMSLVQIAVNGDVPVCKIMDYGRFIFEQKKNKQKAKKDQKINVKKEIKINPNISSNDLSVKSKKVFECLKDGYSVSVVCVFKGRQLDYPEIAIEMLNRIKEDSKSLIKSELMGKLEGKRLILNLVPIKIENSEALGDRKVDIND